MILGVVGDTHGNLGFWRSHVMPRVAQNGLGTIVQLGDFGYWEHTLEGVKYLAKLSNLAVENRVHIYFIDGNHENHAWLRRVYDVQHKGQPAPRPIRENITWLPRGTKGVFGDMTWLACGGAASIDKPRRIPGESWWPEETITDTEVATCRSQGKVDVLFSHDCPLGVEPTQEHAETKMAFPETNANRQRLAAVMKNSRAKLVLHGHWHEYHDDHALEGVRVVGLGCDAYGGNPMVLLDTETLQVTRNPEVMRVGDCGCGQGVFGCQKCRGEFAWL